MRVTLETNGLIHLQNGTGDIDGLRRLIELHSTGVIKLCIPSIAASENQRGGPPRDNYGSFSDFVDSLGITDYEELPAMMYGGMAYVGKAVISGEELQRLERQIHEILFPNIDYLFSDYVARHGGSRNPIDRKWRGAKCDVQALWSHIQYNADIFVTEDGNFHKATKKPKLLALGAGQICTPSEAVTLIPLMAS